MAHLCQLSRWISENRQVGEVFSFEKDGQLYWSSVAIQKWKNTVKVYVDEIMDSQMDAGNYAREEVLDFDTVEGAILFVSENTMTTPQRLAPCKGQKIFKVD